MPSNLQPEIRNLKTRRVVIIGGGVIGAACAYYLRQIGCGVTIVEKGAFGRGCSHGNCGFVCPSHVLPHAGPGAIGNILRAMMQPDSPLTVRPRFDLQLFRWLWGFARRCNEKAMLEAGAAIQALLQSSRTLYDDLLQKPGFDVEWQARGMLFVFLTQAAHEHYAATDQLMRDRFQVGAVRYDGSALNEFEPALKEGLAGGWHYDCDAHLRPDKLMFAFRDHLLARGVVIHEQCEFRNFTSTGRVVQSLETSTGNIPTDAVVIAAGAWTPLLHQALGIRVPVQPGKGYSLTMPRPARCPATPLIFEEHRVAITPMQSGYRIGSTMEFAGYDDTMNRSRLDLLRKGARHYLLEPEAEPVQEEWWGWRPMIYDGKPVIGPTPNQDNVWIAAGHGMLGLSMAPATGRLVSEMISGATPHVDPAPFAVTRF